MVEGVVDLQTDGLLLAVLFEEEQVRQLRNLFEGDLIEIGIQHAESHILFKQQSSDLLVLFVEVLNKQAITWHGSQPISSAVTRRM